MNQQQYLEEVATALRSLPTHEREQELAEIRAHLDAATNAARLRGCTEQDAEAEAIRQFGEARRVGARLRRVWWREQISGPGGLGKTVALAVALRYGVYGLLSPLTNAAGFAYIRLLHEQNYPYPGLLWIVLGLLTTAVPSVMVGVVLARLAPRNAVMGAVLGSVLCIVLPQLSIAGALWSGPVHDPLQAVLLIGTA